MRTIKDAELFNALREYFKVYLPKQKQVSPNTIRSYQNALESLLDYIVKTIPIKLNEVTFDTIDKELSTRRLSAITLIGWKMNVIAANLQGTTD